MSKCRYCKTETVWDEKGACWRCPKCHPPTDGKPTPPKEKPKLLDIKFTEEQIRNIVRDELENWHIKKPAVTRDEVEKLTDKERLSKAIEKSFMAKTAHKSDAMGPTEASVPNWRQQAKELGIKIFGKKKVDILAEIEAKKNQN